MSIEMFKRLEDPLIILEYKVPKRIDPVATEDQLNESSVPDSNLTMEVVIMKGAKMTEYMNMSTLLNMKKDSMFLSAFGLFMLHEKYHTLNLVNFCAKDDANPSQEIVEGHLVAEKLKEKNQNQPLYNAFLLLVLTKNLKFLYLNLDQVIIAEKIQDVPFKMTVFDKIYGQQSFVVASKLIAVGNKIAPYLQCLSEFRMSYVKN